MSDDEIAREVGVFIPPPYLRIEAWYGVIICTKHRTAYTPENVAEHLFRAHGTRKSQRQKVLDWVASQQISYTVSEPAD